MSQTLTDLFETSGSNSVTWQGRQVMALVEIPVGGGDRIRIRRLGSSLVRAQALKLAVDRGALTVGGYSGPVVALWSHTAPADLVVEVDGPASAIKVWNAWSLDGVDNSWLGNAGVIVDEHGGGLTLQCSDGVGEPDFSDLVVWVAVTSARPVVQTEKVEPESPKPKTQGAPRTRPISDSGFNPMAKPKPPAPKSATESRAAADQTDASASAEKAPRESATPEAKAQGGNPEPGADETAENRTKPTSGPGNEKSDD